MTSGGRPSSSERRLTSSSSRGPPATGPPSASPPARTPDLVLRAPAHLVLSGKDLWRPTLRLLVCEDVQRLALILRASTDLILAGEDLQRPALRLLAGKDIPRGHSISACRPGARSRAATATWSRRSSLPLPRRVEPPNTSS